MYSVTFQQRYLRLTQLNSAHLLLCLFLDHSLNANPIYVVMQNDPDSGHDHTGVHTE